ncbi:MAG: Asp/Glu racemase, partial [Alphaproteobacteria bacterium]|nr:Asp/Glu racemase [Alphaproteobacteria bacterium]
MTDRILLINPNTTAAITDKVVAAARALAPDVTFTAVTGRFGARYVASRAAYAIAGHAALDAWANAGDDHDAVILACFGDPGLNALRELSPKPVVGMADAALHAAL